MKKSPKTMPVVSVASARSLGHYLHPSRMTRELWAHRKLITQLSRREITQRQRGTYLGIFWSFLTPFLMRLIATFSCGF